MFRLLPPPEPRWLDLPQGVRVQVRAVTLAEQSAMESHAARRIAALRAEIKQRDELGAPRDGLPDLDDEDIRRGLSTAYVAEGFAKAVIMAWEGVGDPAGNAAPCTAANLAAFAVSPLAMPFLEALLAPLAGARAEGNGSAPVPPGSGAPGANGAGAAAANALPAPGG